MDVRCEKCGTEYEFDENRIGANGVTVKCTACGHVFKVRRPGPSTLGPASDPRRSSPPAAGPESGARRAIPRASTTIGQGPQGREWLVRKPDGQMIAFRELTTLQKWIVEGRIGRDDEISKNGETWKRLGNIMELEPFFSVYEKAQALNSMIEQGNLEGRPMELRGSELLAAMSPLEGPRSGARAPMPSESHIIHADPLPSRPPPPRAGSLSAIPAGPVTNPFNAVPLGPRQGPPPRPTSAIAAPPLQGRPMAPAAPPPLMVPTAPPTSGAQRPLGSGPSEAAFGSLAPSLGSAPRAPAGPPPFGPRSSPLMLDHGAPPMATGLAGPGALDGPGSEPPLRKEATTPGASSGDDPVETFRRGQRRARVLVFGLLLVGGGLGVAAAVALYGPEGNPARLMAERYGLAAVRPLDDGGDRLLDDAWRALDMDTFGSQAEAVELLAQAHGKRPGDAAVAAGRALAGALLAQAEQSFAQDLEAAAARAEEQAKETKTAAATAPLLASAAERRASAEQRSADALSWAEAARKADAKGLEPIRALALVQLVRGDRAAFEASLAEVKAAVERAGRTDAYTLWIEALGAAPRPEQAGAQAQAKAAALLEQALSARPSMNRARAQYARVLSAKGDLGAAKVQIARVLAAAPEHEEAKRLEGMVEATERERLAKEKAAAEKAEAEKVKAAEAEAAKQAGPRTFEQWMVQADRLRERDRTAAALDAYGRAAELKPDSAEPHTGKGWCYLDMDKPHPALAAFQRAIQANDRYADAYYGLAEANRALGKTDAAIRAYEQYLARAPAQSSERRTAEQRLAELKKGS